jgi:hypothetical protein
LHFSYDLFNVSCNSKGFSLSYQQKISAFNASLVVFSLTPPLCPYATSMGGGGKYLKQVSNGDLLVEIWTDLL